MNLEIVRELQLADRIEKAVERLYRDETEPSRPHFVWASGIEKCARKMFNRFAFYQSYPKFEPRVKQRLEQGNREEMTVAHELERAGIKVLKKGLDVNIAGRGDLGQVISGRIDGTLDIRSTGWFQNLPVYEIPFDTKSVTPLIYDRLHCQEDFFRFWWTPKYVYQLLLYMYGLSYPVGCLILSDCLGHRRVIFFELETNLVMVEEAITKAELVISRVKEFDATGRGTAQEKEIAAGLSPDYIDDPAECRRCWCYGVCCEPAIDMRADLVVINDDELYEAMSRALELEAQGKEYAALDRKIKAAIKERQIKKYAVAGDIFIAVKEQQRTSYQIPDDVKKQYATTSTATLIKYERPAANGPNGKGVE